MRETSGDRFLKRLAQKVAIGLSKVATEARAAGLPYLAILVFCLFLSLVNVGGDYTLRFIDIAWPLNPHNQLISLTYAWSAENLGDVNVLNFFNAPALLWILGLHDIGLSPQLQEVVSLTCWQFLAGAYAFRLFKEYLLRDRDIRARTAVSLGASLACLANFVVLTSQWWDGIPNGFIMLGFGIPAIFYITQTFDSFIQTGRLKWMSLALGLAFGSVGLSVNVPSNFSLVVLLIVVPLFTLRNRPYGRDKVTLRRVLGFYSIAIVGLSVTSLWWVYPSLLETQWAPTYLNSLEGLSGGALLFQQSTSSLTILAVLGGLFGYGYLWSAHLQTVNAVYLFGGSAASFLMLVIPGFTVLVRRKDSFWGPQLALAIILLITLVLTGINSPIYGLVLNQASSNAFFLLLFRTPVVALGFAFYFVLIISFAEAAVLLPSFLLASKPVTEVPLNRFRRAERSPGRVASRGRMRRHTLAAVIAAFLAVAAPFALTAPAAFVGNALPGAPYQSHMQIPAFETDTADFVRGHLGGYYVLLFPGGFLEQNWTAGYDGYDVLPDLLAGLNVIDNYRTGFLQGTNQLLTLAYTTLETARFSGLDLAHVLQLLAVKYLVIEGEVGGGYPFASTAEPNYPALLNSLNSSRNISLAETFGPNHIYLVTNPNPVFVPANAVIQENSLGANDTLPGVNITSLYYNTTLISSPSTPRQILFPQWEGGLTLNLTPKIKAALSSTPLGPPFGGSYPPSIFNGVPISLNASAWRFLSIRFETNPYTAISVSLVCAQDLTALNESEFASVDLSAAGPGNSLGLGDPALFSAYGAGYFTSPGRWSNMTIDLQQVLQTIPSLTAFYLVVSVFPVDQNGNGLRGVPVSMWPDDQEVAIDSVILGSSFYLRPVSVPDVPRVGLTGLIPLTNVTREYYNGTISNASTAPPHNVIPSLEGNSILFSLNNLSRAYIQEHPLAPPLGPSRGPTFYNAVPLEIESSDYPYFSVNFSTNQNVAVSFSIVTLDNLSEANTSTFDSNDFPLLGPAVNLGYGNATLLPYYGAGYFTSPQGFTTLVADLNEVLPSNDTDRVGFLLLGMVPVADNGSGLPGVPLSSWPAYENVSISSVTFSKYVVRWSSPPSPNDDLVNEPQLLPTAEPSESDDAFVVPVQISNLAQGLLVDFTSASPVQYALTISRELAGGNQSGLIVFAQNFDTIWSAEDVTGGVIAEHVLVDGALNGFVVRFFNSSTQVSLQLIFQGQQSFVGVETVLVTISILLPCSIALIPVCHKKLRGGVRRLRTQK